MSVLARDIWVLRYSALYRGTKRVEMGCDGADLTVGLFHSLAAGQRYAEGAYGLRHDEWLTGNPEETFFFLVEAASEYDVTYQLETIEFLDE